ncbi:hypothetical protein [Nocardia stercoris]|uniref:Uncharacterized protein n=1 Tax=Nocardia stercoris TaxID=2483361 RepID=A0A3M2L0K0_9NOCA|nr:hypothetical protein [Nocardia stercoris]RMI29325.1 hypothetical protein EBN03_26725 [Nocardia stercoris]
MTAATRVRGAAAGTACGALAVAAHGSAGTLPGSSDTTLLLLVSALVGAGVAVAGGSRIRLFGLLGAGQALCHALLAADIAPGHGGMAMPGQPGWAMVGAHAVATAMCTLLIAAAERFHRALTRVAWALLRLFDPRPHNPDQLIQGPQAIAWAGRRGLSVSISRRGPPVFAAAH